MKSMEKFKENIARVCLSGFPDKEERTKVSMIIQALQIDCDNVKNPELKQIISKDDHVCFVEFHPQGQVKAAMRIPKHPKLNMLIHLEQQKMSQGKYKIKIDSACRNTARIMFLLHDKI